MYIHPHSRQKDQKTTVSRSNADRINKIQSLSGHPEPIQKKANRTGLPDTLKTGIESLSGYSMDDVKVHYHSEMPAQLQAHAYAQGTDIHIAPGQEKYLPHEAWHVVQQKQGKVKPVRQLKKGIPVNDDTGLEREADLMGAQALQMKYRNGSHMRDASSLPPVIQMGGNKVTQTIEYGIGGLLMGAAFCLLLKNRPELAGKVLYNVGLVLLPTILGGWYGYQKGKKLDDKEEWENLGSILKLYPNHQPQNLETEIENFREQKENDGGKSFIVSYKNKKEFERCLNSGQEFIWVYTKEKDLRIGSKEKNQHSVVGNGKKVYSAGEGIKPSAVSKVGDLKNSIQHIEDKIKNAPHLREGYESTLRYLYSDLQKEVIKKTQEEKVAGDIVRINLRSGHYAPDIDMDRWTISVYAWKQANYKALPVRGKGEKFLPEELRQQETKKDK